MVAKWIIGEGCIWRIGNGRVVKVFKDKWVPNLLGNWVLVEGDKVNREMVVNYLMWDEVGKWNVDLVDNIFPMEVVGHIKALSLKISYCDDWLAWKHSNNGIYTIRSGYHIAQTRFSPVKSGSNGPTKIWSLVWKGNALPKCKNFIWRACS